MGYVLVFVSLLGTGEVAATSEGHYLQMSTCFEERELLLKELKREADPAEQTVQAVCLAAPDALELAMID